METITFRKTEDGKIEKVITTEVVEQVSVDEFDNEIFNLKQQISGFENEKIRVQKEADERIAEMDEKIAAAVEKINGVTTKKDEIIEELKTNIAIQ